MASFLDDDSADMTAEQMQKQIDELEAAIAGAGAENDEFQPESTEEDPDLEKIRAELASLEEEIAKVSVDPSSIDSAGVSNDMTSIYVGNVDYGASAEELQSHFLPCGSINRCTIICNKSTGQPMGFAYVEFADEIAVTNALELSDSLFRGRQLKVLPKRVNVPGFSRLATRGGRFSLGSPGRFRGRPRFRGYAPSSYRGYSPFPPRGGAFRPRPRRFSRFHHPYSAFY